MKIVIDISQLHPAALKRGVGFYSLNLFKALCKLNDNNQYILKKEKSSGLEADLIHYPYFDPFFLTLPLIKTRPTVVTVHDLIPLKFPKHFKAGFKGKIKWSIQKFSLKQVKAIITVSESSKKEIIEIIGFPKKRIFPIHLAASEEYKKLEIRNWQLKIRKRLHLPKTFLLYVGDINWNKNIKGLIEAFKIVKNKNNELKLILTGPAFANNNLKELKEIKNLIKKLKLENETRLLGFIPTIDLVKIYNLATLYIQPSFYEGFGLPVLEALSCGCPVLCSNQASLAEVGGRAVEYFNPNNKNEFIKKLVDLIANKEKLKALSVLGLRQAEKFSWRKTALKTRKVYEKVFKKY